MRRLLQTALAALLMGALLAACGPLAAAPQPTPDVDATVAARVEATVRAEPTAEPTITRVACCAAPTDTPEAAQPTKAPQVELEPPSPSPSKPTQAPAEPTAAPTTQPVDASGPLLVAAGANGTVSVLSSAGWSLPTLPESTISSCANDSQPGFDANGAIWLSCGATIRSSDGATWERVQEQLDTVVAGPHGELASAGRDELKLFANGAWKTYTPAETTKEQAFPYRAVVFAPDGTLWLGGFAGDSSPLVSFDGKVWKTYPQAGPDGVDSLVVTRKGEVLAATNWLYRFDGTTFAEAVPKERINKLTGQGGGLEVRRMVEAPDGAIIAATNYGVLRWAGDDLKLITVADGLPSGDVRDVAIDADGNVWAATSYGVAVGRDDKWQAAQPATSGIAESDIVSLAVRGAPKLPPPAAAKTASIAGKLTKEGKIVPNATVELCVDTNSPLPALRGASYCAGQSFTRLATTDAAGAYRFDDVPLGNYALVATVGDRVTIPTSLDVKVLKGGENVSYDLTLN